MKVPVPLMSEKLELLKAECDILRKRLLNQTELQKEVETLKDELEKSLETHTKLQELALAFEEENRNMNEKYRNLLTGHSRLNAIKLDLEHEIDTKTQSYKNLEKRFNKVKEKSDSYEDLADTVYNLEKDNRRKTEKIAELQDQLDTLSTGEKKTDEKVNKLTKENSEMALKLETYIEEMEEMDAKVESLEDENKLLKKEAERIKNIEMFGSSVNELAVLENEKNELEAKLKKEVHRRENVEHELFRIEEELENLKFTTETRENELSESLHELTNERKIFMQNGSDDEVMLALQRKQVDVESLIQEKTEIEMKVKNMEQEHEILLEENSSLALVNSEMTKKMQEIERSAEIKENKLESKIEELLDVRKKLQEELLQRLVQSGEKELASHQASHRETERYKEELSVAQEYLKLANKRNAELQLEVERLRYKQDHLEGENNERKQVVHRLQEVKEDAMKRMSMDLSELDQANMLMTQTISHHEQERKEYEDRIFMQNQMIQRLRQANIENQSMTSHSTASPETTPPVAIKNGKLHDSMDELSSHSRSSSGIDVQEQISDRELRRISYKIADGTWNRLPYDLALRNSEIAHILNSPANEKDKVYNVLVTWRNKSVISREEQLQCLSDVIDPKRKDVAKFLREMAGVVVKDTSGLKNKLHKLKKSVKIKN